MADWQERVQSMIIGFVFAYMVMKLVAVISSFRAGNMRVERASDEDEAVLVAAGEGQGVATDEEAEADGGDEQGESSSSASSSDDDDADAAPASQSKDADVVAEKDAGVEVQEGGKDVAAPGDQSLKAMATDDP